MALPFLWPSTRSWPCSPLWLPDCEVSSLSVFCSDWANPPIGLPQRKSLRNGFQSRNAAGPWHFLTVVPLWVAPSPQYSSFGYTFISAAGSRHSFLLERLDYFGWLPGVGSTIPPSIIQRSAQP